MEKSTGKIIAGFIFGAAVGVVAGLLFAPRSGAETRKKIQKKAKEYSDEVARKAGEKIDELKEFVGEMTNEAKTKGKKAADQA